MQIDNETLVQALSEIASLDSITPDAVVDAARSPNHPLHDAFEWDVNKAAAEHWRDTARGLIRKAREVAYVHREVETAPTYVPMYVSNPAVKESSYVAVKSIKTNEEIKRDVMIAEVKHIVGCLRRAAGLLLELGMDDDMEVVESMLSSGETLLKKWSE